MIASMHAIIIISNYYAYFFYIFYLWKRWFLSLNVLIKTKIERQKCNYSASRTKSRSPLVTNLILYIFYGMGIIASELQRQYYNKKKKTA